MLAELPCVGVSRGGTMLQGVTLLKVTLEDIFVLPYPIIPTVRLKSTNGSGEIQNSHYIAFILSIWSTFVGQMSFCRYKEKWEWGAM